MSAAQAIASRRFLKAMGSMVEDEQRLNEVLEYIESIKIRPLCEQITEEEKKQLQDHRRQGDSCLR